MADTYGTNQTQDPSAGIYDAVRRRLQQQGQANLQQNQEQLKRQFAANGNLASGEYAKMNQQVTDQTQAQTQDASSQLDLAEQQELQRRKEVSQGMDFQSQEAEKQRGFQTSERQSSQIFNKDLYDQDMAFKKSVQDSNVHFAQLDSDLRQKEFEASRYNDYINTIIGFGNASIDANKLGYIQGEIRNLGPNKDWLGTPVGNQYGLAYDMGANRR